MKQCFVLYFFLMHLHWHWLIYSLKQCFAQCHTAELWFTFGERKYIEYGWEFTDLVSVQIKAPIL